MRKILTGTFIVVLSLYFLRCSGATTFQTTIYQYDGSFSTFDELIAYDYGRFYYGCVTRIVPNNMYVDSIYFEIFSKNGGNTGYEIRISELIDHNGFVVGDIYILHLVYNAEYEYYSLSSASESVFKVLQSSVEPPDEFVEEFSDSELVLDQFLRRIDVHDKPEGVDE